MAADQSSNRALVEDPLYESIPEMLLATVEDLTDDIKLESISCSLTEMNRLYEGSEAYFIMPTTGNGCV